MNFRNLPDGGLRKNKMAKNALPLANKRTNISRINENMVPNVDKIVSGLDKIVELMNIHKNYVEESIVIGAPTYSKAATDEMKEQYNTLITDIEALSFTPYVIV